MLTKLNIAALVELERDLESQVFFQVVNYPHANLQHSLNQFFATFNEITLVETIIYILNWPINGPDMAAILS